MRGEKNKRDEIKNDSSYVLYTSYVRTKNKTKIYFYCVR